MIDSNSCLRCKNDLEVVDVRRIFYGFVVTLKCENGHLVVEWRKGSPDGTSLFEYIARQRVTP